MTTFEAFLVALMLATFLCSLVAGFLFAFAVVVMPGIRTLDDDGFLRAFQVMDRVIQNGQTLFVVVWGGSVLALISATALGVSALGGIERVLIVAAALLYLLGVQWPTLAINIPLNNAIQALNIGAINEPARRHAREVFEPRWNRWNTVRTAGASLASLLLMLLLTRV